MSLPHLRSRPALQGWTFKPPPHPTLYNEPNMILSFMRTMLCKSPSPPLPPTPHPAPPSPIPLFAMKNRKNGKWLCHFIVRKKLQKKLRVDISRHIPPPSPPAHTHTHTPPAAFFLLTDMHLSLSFFCLSLCALLEWESLGYLPGLCLPSPSLPPTFPCSSSSSSSLSFFFILLLPPLSSVWAFALPQQKKRIYPSLFCNVSPFPLLQYTHFSSFPSPPLPSPTDPLA